MHIVWEYKKFATDTAWNLNAVVKNYVNIQDLFIYFKFFPGDFSLIFRLINLHNLHHKYTLVFMESIGYSRQI